MNFFMSAAKHTVILMAFVFIVPYARAVNLEPIIKAAHRAAVRDQQVEACDLYLEVLPRLDDATDRDRLLVLRGLHETVQALVSKGLMDSAVKGLIGLLDATAGKDSQKVPGPDFARMVRKQMDLMGFDLLRKGNPELAARLLRALVADGPSPALRWALLARATMRSGEFEKASETIKRGLAVYPGSPELLFSRADLSGYLSQRAVMRSNYRAAEHLLLRAHRDLSNALKTEKAAGIYRAMGRICASLWNYYSATGRYELATASLDEAEEAYENASLLDLQDSNSLFELGDFLFSARDYPFARQTFRHACSRIRHYLAHGQIQELKRKIVRMELSRCRKREAACTRIMAAHAEAYQKALEDGRGKVTARGESKGDGSSNIPNTSVNFSMIIGQLEVHASLPPFMDPGDFRGGMEKAHAITMAAFPNKLVGPFDVKVFADRDSYLRVSGMDVRKWLGGSFAYGKMLTFYDSSRSRMSWLRTLVGGLTFRYVDEMTYHNCPLWLSDGIAQHVAMGWDRDAQQHFDGLRDSNLLLPWSVLESLMDGEWASPEASENAHLQAHQMVRWLYDRFGQHRVWAFLAQLRGGRSLDAASSAAFGKNLAELEELWQEDGDNAN